MPEKPGKIWKSAGTSNDKNFEDSSHLSGLFRIHSCIILYIVIWNETNYPSYLFIVIMGSSVLRSLIQLYVMFSYCAHLVTFPIGWRCPAPKCCLEQHGERLSIHDRWAFGFYRREWKEHGMDDDSVIYVIWSNLYFLFLHVSYIIILYIKRQRKILKWTLLGSLLFTKSFFMHCIDQVVWWLLEPLALKVLTIRAAFGRRIPLARCLRVDGWTSEGLKMKLWKKTWKQQQLKKNTMRWRDQLWSDIMQPTFRHVLCATWWCLAGQGNVRGSRWSSCCDLT